MIIDNENFRQAVGYYSYLMFFPFSKYSYIYDSLICQFTSDAYGAISFFISGIMQLSLVVLFITLVYWFIIKGMYINETAKGGLDKDK